MGKQLRRLCLLVGLVLFLFDYGSDIYVAVQYWKNNDFWWFGMTIGFIIIPSIMVNITATVQVMNYWRSIMAVLQLSIVVRYIEALILPDSRRIYLLAKLRYLETITESAPQWCLQVYIMLRQWHFPSYTLISSGLSLLSLTWSIWTLEKERATDEARDFKSLHIALFLIWQLFTLVSRLFAIVLFAYVFRYYVIIFLAAHWLLLVVAMLIIQIYYYAIDSLGKSLLLSCLAGCPSLFHSSETVLPTRKPKVEMIVGYIFIVLENIIMVTLSLTIEMPDVSHMDVLTPVAIACVGGATFLSFIFIFVYYYCVDPY
jgi:hypothetical protein